MSQPSPAKLQQLRAQFRKFDTSGDGKLDLREMSILLRRGNPNLTDAQLRVLFNGVDTNKDGRVDFDEFVAYIYSSSEESQESAPPEAPEDVEVVFQTFAGGPTMDGVKFAKLCRDCGLIDRATFPTRDVDTTFANVVPKGRRAIQFPDFLKALVIIARKKGMDIDDLYGLVGDSAPITKGTKADAVRFHDDKRQYTGVAASRAQEQHRNSTGSTSSTSAVGRQPSNALRRPGSSTRSPPKELNLVRESSLTREPSHARAPTEPSPSGASKDTSPRGGSIAPSEAGEDDLDWNLLDKAFFDYAGKSDDLDGREFSKLCADCGLYDRKFTRRDVDIVFQSVMYRGERRMQFGQFIDALKKIAQRREVAPYFVHKAVLANSGPKLNGATKADAVRFHDDKTTYTGMHSVMAT
mmetsp:Transcript_83674/g.231911  ORF Transcript_83674/g.231911 Transcript_83674/m.231911 type:complete len:410 (-) Transcript_83674:117-1346(-)